MKVAILISSYENSNSEFKEFCEIYDPSVFNFQNKQNTYYQWYLTEMKIESETFAIKKSCIYSQVNQIVQRKEFYMFLNLCDGAQDEDIAGVEVIQALEYYNVPYTGANQLFYNQKKEHTKMMAHYSQIPSPNFCFIYNLEDLSIKSQHLKYPLIVKHHNGYGSAGITKDSKIENYIQLEKRCKEVIQEYSGALVEEFIYGREFAVLIVENPEDKNNPIVLQPVECVFLEDEQFKHYDIKWNQYQKNYYIPVDDDYLKSRLKSNSKDIFKATNGNSYGRVDLRMDDQGVIYVLDMNPNCCLFEKDESKFDCGDKILKFESMGHSGFINLIIQSALKAHLERQKNYVVEYSQNLGYCIKSNKFIAKDTLIQQYEERPHYLASTKQTQKWGKFEQQQLQRFGFLINKYTYITWSNNPDEWIPINHSCNPNSHLEGLNLLARRDIQKGEFITMEYATFCIQMQQFNCMCQSNNCRRIVSENDYLKPQIQQQFQGHFSEYLQELIDAKTSF